MQSSKKLKITSFLSIISAVVLHFFLFDRGLLALLAPTIFIFGSYMSFLAIKQERGWKKAIIPIILWVLAIIINRVSGSYEYYSEYDFIDPLNGFILSSILALSALSLTVYYFLRKSPDSNIRI
jgi:hypothetical protein